MIGLRDTWQLLSLLGLFAVLWPVITLLRRRSPALPAAALPPQDAGRAGRVIAAACARMTTGRERRGALIAILPPGESPSVERAVPLDAVLSEELLVTLFAPGSPLHDGAVLVREGRVVAARAVLPNTRRSDVPPHVGTRHLAAIGFSEVSEARVVVVSEETGEISLSQGGRLEQGLSRERLAECLGC